MTGPLDVDAYQHLADLIKGFHAIVLSKVWGFGSNQHGELGAGQSNALGTGIGWRMSLPGLPNEATVLGLAAGETDTFAWTSNHAVYACGDNSCGQLGISSFSTPDYPEQISEFAGRNVVAVSAGSRHTLVLLDDHTVYAFGNRAYGQLGCGKPTFIPPLPPYLHGQWLGVNLQTPVHVESLDGKGIKAIAAGEAHSLALGEDGTVYASGSNAVGQLGIDPQALQALPEGDTDIHEGNPCTFTFVPVSGLPEDEPIDAIAAGYAHSLALTRTHHVYAWGANNASQLGASFDWVQVHSSSTPLPISQMHHLPDIQAIAAGGYHSLALTTEAEHQRLWAWGSNWKGELGAHISPQETGLIPNPLYSAAGDPLTITVPCTSTPTSLPWWFMSATDNLKYKEIAAGSFHSLAVTLDGKVMAWGWNAQGQLGMETATTELWPDSCPTPFPMMTLVFSTAARTIAAGGNHSLVLVQ